MSVNSVELTECEPEDDKIWTIDLEAGERKNGSIILLDDNGKSEGIRPRTCTVYKVGKNVTDFKAGDRLLVEHGEWTFGLHCLHEGKQVRLNLVMPKGIIAILDEDTKVESFGDYQ